jgi:hypothetical protein
MGTRCVFQLQDEISAEPITISQHWDGYPEGAFKAIAAAIPISWGVDRFEADQFAAALLAANKTDGGNYRVCGRGRWVDLAPDDIEYAYEIGPQEDGQVWVIPLAVECTQPGSWNMQPAGERITLRQLAEKMGVAS